MIVEQPVIAVSQSGDTVAIAAGTDVLLVDSNSGAVTTRSAPFSPAIVAMAPNRAATLVVASETLLGRVGGRDDNVRELPGRAMLVRTGDSGTVVAVARSDADGAHLVVATGSALEPVIAPAPLGPVATWGLELEESSRSAVLWGVIGDDAWEGRGNPYVRRVVWASSAAEVDWTGAGLPDDTRLLRLGGGRLVAHAGDRLVTSTVQSLVEHGRPDGGEIAVPDGVDRLAISVDGAIVAVERERVVSTATFGEEELVRRGAVAREVSPMHLAVGLDGSIVVCGFADSVTVVGFLAARRAELEEAWRIRTADIVNDDA